MSQAFTAEATIDRPAADVWRTLTDWGNAHRWMSGVDWIRAEGGTEPGTQLTFHARGRERPATISAIDPGRSVAIRSTQGGVAADYVYELHDVGAATRVTLAADYQTTGLPWTLLGPVLRFAMRRTDGDQLDSLKALVEAR